MDPLSALAVAAAVVQFADFGGRLLADAARVYRSVDGQTSQYAQLESIYRDLNELGRTIEAKSVALLRPNRPLRSTEQILVRLCGDCRGISAQLNEALGRLKADKRNSGRLNFMRESFAVALRSFWSREHIDGLRESLAEVRRQMMMASLTVLWEESISGTNELNQLSRQQADMMSTLDRIDHASRTLSQSVMQLAQTGSSTSGTSQTAMVNAIWSSKWTPGSPLAEMTASLWRPEQVVSVNEDNIDKFCTLSIINSFLFEELEFREEAIPIAYQRTFEWVFTEPTGRAQWSNFYQWLQMPETQIYWITGKPGAGKSTLMKFLIHHPATKQLLERWSGSRPLLLATFYFWNAGSAMQRSQEGLLRTLLYQCLCQVPHLIPKVCPRRWALFKIFGKEALRAAPEWTWHELMESFSVLDLYVGKHFNLCLFVDGLDEFDGNLTRLIEFIKLFHSRPGTKICVSSRPWNAFSDAFRKNPSLRLEDLTNRDIELFVNGYFRSNQGFMELQQASTSEAQRLLDQVIFKAEGVFLWVSVVVLALTEGLTEGDTLRNLQDTVDELPSDLSKLYQRIWFRIKPSYAAQSSQLFQIHKASASNLDVITLWLAEDEQALSFDINTMTQQKRLHIIQLMRRRLNSRTRGLLEISPEGKVDYLHRSVRDWISPIWNDICARSSPDCDPNLALLKAMTVQISDDKFWTKHFISLPDDFWRKTCVCFYYAAKVRDYGPNIPQLINVLDRLDRDLTKISVSHSLGNSVPPLYAEAMSHRSAPRGALPHWSTTQRKDLPSNTMVGLAAQFGVTPYVRHKVLYDPRIVHHDDSISILACATFGFRYFCSPAVSRFVPQSTPFYPDQRCGLVMFLLENGAVSPSKDGRKGKHPGLSVYKEIQKRPFQVQPVILPHRQGPVDYWTELLHLLNSYGDFSREGRMSGFVSKLFDRFSRS